MAQTINLSTGEIKAAAAKVRELAGQVTNSQKNLMSMGLELQSCWTGQSAESYNQSATQYAGDLATWVKALNESARLLDEYAAKHAALQAQRAAENRSLNNK